MWWYNEAPMFFRQILHEEKSCLSYIVGCQTKGVCAVIDAQGNPALSIAEAQKHNLKIRAVIETHIQADHVSASFELARLTGASLYFGSEANVQYRFQPLADGESFSIGNRTIRVIHTPGHTPEHICLLVDDWFLLTGDTLFVGDVGRVDLSLGESTPGEIEHRAYALYHSLQKLLLLPEWMEVYPGHYAGSSCGRGMDGKPISTIGREKRKNKPLQLSKQEFIQYQQQNTMPAPQDFQRIKKGNLGID